VVDGCRKLLGRNAATKSNDSCSASVEQNLSYNHLMEVIAIELKREGGYKPKNIMEWAWPMIPAYGEALKDVMEARSQSVSAHEIFGMRRIRGSFSAWMGIVSRVPTFQCGSMLHSNLTIRNVEEFSMDLVLVASLVKSGTWSRKE